MNYFLFSKKLKKLIYYDCHYKNKVAILSGPMPKSKRTKKFNKPNDSKVADPLMLFQVFQVFKYMIWDFFLDDWSNGKTNNSKNSNSLIIASRAIREALYAIYLTRACFTFEDARQMNPLNRSWIRQMSYNDQILWASQIIEVAPCLQKLHFGHEFDHTMDPRFLSTSLTELSFGSFNQTIGPGDLPTGLTKLSFGDSFDQTIEAGVLPTGLIELSFGIGFNKLIGPGILPTSLTKLSSWGTNQKISPGVLPDNIRELDLCCFNRKIKRGLLPGNLEILILGCFDEPLDADTLPDSIRELSLGSFNQEIKQGVLPSNLEILDLYSFNQPLDADVLPSNLERLILGYFDQPLDADTLPKNLVYLEISASYSHSLIGVLPKNLKSLIFGFSDSYGFINAIGIKPKHVELVPGLIPDSVQKLSFLDPGFDQDLERILPPGLTELSFGREQHDYIKPLKKSNGNCFLPLTLKKLVFFFSNDTLNILTTEEWAKIFYRIKNLDFGQNYFPREWFFSEYKDRSNQYLAWVLKQ